MGSSPTAGMSKESGLYSHSPLFMRIFKYPDGRIILPKNRYFVLKNICIHVILVLSITVNICYFSLLMDYQAVLEFPAG